MSLPKSDLTQRGANVRVQHRKRWDLKQVELGAMIYLKTGHTTQVPMNLQDSIPYCSPSWHLKNVLFFFFFSLMLTKPWSTVVFCFVSSQYGSWSLRCFASQLSTSSSPPCFLQPSQICYFCHTSVDVFRFNTSARGIKSCISTVPALCSSTLEPN